MGGREGRTNIPALVTDNMSFRTQADGRTNIPALVTDNMSFRTLVDGRTGRLEANRTF